MMRWMRMALLPAVRVMTHLHPLILKRLITGNALNVTGH